MSGNILKQWLGHRKITGTLGRTFSGPCDSWRFSRQSTMLATTWYFNLTLHMAIGCTSKCSLYVGFWFRASQIKIHLRPNRGKCARLILADITGKSVAARPMIIFKSSHLLSQNVQGPGRSTYCAWSQLQSCVITVNQWHDLSYDYLYHSRWHTH